MLEKVIQCCHEAGDKILQFYGTDLRVAHKEDKSPLTAADRASHDFLAGALKSLAPDVPVISEEDESFAEVEKLDQKTFWLVDPLDGTKEFLKRSGDFTVNVALVQNGRPTAGVVYVPVRGTFYFAEKGKGAWRQERGSPPVQIHVGQVMAESLRIVASKDHAGPEVEALLRRLPAAQVTSIGSSLKFCLIAEGNADLYPRFVPTMEWDTAAAQCIVEEAGGRVLTLDGCSLTYGKTDWKNPAIITVGDADFKWRDLMSDSFGQTS